MHVLRYSGWFQLPDDFKGGTSLTYNAWWGNLETGRKHYADLSV